jgi:hypothetical protein|nr:MAG TPA: PVL ORF-50-like family [Caudoviricetes sp.]
MKDLTGMTFGRLTVLRFSRKIQKHYFYTCQCKCGNIKDVRSDQLTRGIAKSCGCLQKDIAKVVMAQTMRTHGMAKHPLHHIFNTMKQRCYNPKCREYKDYGERGIHICDEWLRNRSIFYKWAMENGYKKGLTIDRINVNGNYSPCNCRFVPMNVQCRNKRCNIVITYKGQTKILADWCTLLNLNYNAIYARLGRGWTIEKAFTTPIRKLSKRNQ